VRRFIAGLAAAAFVLTAAAAQAAGPTRLTLSVTGYKVLYGHQLTVSGRVTNGLAGQGISILAHSYGTTSAKAVAIVTTRKGGNFSYFAHPTIRTMYTARMGSIQSRSLTVGVSPTVRGTELGNGQILASVAIGKNMAGHLIKLQRQAGSTWQTVAQRPLDRLANATFSPLPTDATLRLAFSVNEAGNGYLGATTHLFGYRAYKLTLLPSSLAVVYGGSVTLAGRLVNGRPGQAIAIAGQTYGHKSSTHIATVRTKAGGAWMLRVSPKLLTTYRATWNGTEQSARIPVGVKPLITARELVNGKVLAHVQADRSFFGRFVKLQQQMPGGSWSTVLQAQLNRSSTATFTPSLPTSHLRIAMSVNAAGVGFLGGFSHVVAYHAT
jgi:hypothetical protein